MKRVLSLALVLAIDAVCLNLSAQNYKAERLKQAVEILDLQIFPDSLLPEKTFFLTAKDGCNICLRTDPMGEIEHVGIPLFTEIMRFIQPCPVYDFLEYAVLNWKYKINPNQLYLSKVIFKQGSWETLLQKNLIEYDCSIENQEDKFFVVTWIHEDKEIAVIGIPIEYELLNNDTRRNMERAFIRELEKNKPTVTRNFSSAISENELCIYGTEGLFVLPGSSYLIDLLNQNVYYRLTTVYETTDTVIRNEKVTISMEAVVPVLVIDTDFPAETFANLIMCDDVSVPDASIELDFHLSNYHRERITVPMSQLKAFCHQQGCNLYFACNGSYGGKVHGMMIVSNLLKGYNHLFSLRIPSDQLLSPTPTVQADAYLYIPPIDKTKLIGTVPTKKSGVKFK